MKSDVDYLLRKADERKRQGRVEHADFLTFAAAQYFQLLDKVDLVASEAFRLGAQAQRARDLSICYNEFRKDPNNARLAVCADRISRADIVTQQDQLMAMP